MKVYIDKSFEKDTNQIKDSKTLKKLALIIEQVITCKNLDEIIGLKKLQGFRDYYRIRVGVYRIGLRIVDNEAYFERFLHRKEIYKYYP
jgi:mRNA interferase RelE/StbE